MAAGSNWKDESGQIVKRLIETGIDVNIKNNKGKTALMYAAENDENEGKIIIVTMLLEAGADVNTVDDEGMSALDYAIENNNLELIKVLRSKSGN
jgi:ankyrin repeat protein